MRDRLFNRTTLSGIGAWILSVLPFFQEGSMMNATSWALLAIGTILVLWGILKREHQLSPKEAANLLKDRAEYLPKLKNNIQEQTKQVEHIRDIASKITFTQYLGKYYSFLKGTKKRSSFIGKIGDIPWAIRIVPSGVTNNLYYHDLKKMDDLYNSLETEYELLLPEIKDRKLKKKLKNFWDLEDMNNSRIAFGQMVKNDKYPISPEARKIANKMEKFYKRSLKLIPITEIMERIDELLDGEPDE